MTFDSHSLDRLKELGRKLPKEISEPKTSDFKNSKETKKQKLHPVEVENSPEQLFRELMEISPDGNVPPHLLDRLKQLESNVIESKSNSSQIINNDPEETNTYESLNLYTQFKQLLLEDDVN